MDATVNDGVFRCLADRPEARRGEPAVLSPDDPKHDYYMDSGAHPDIVQRLWDQLGKALPIDSRALVFGTPALVHRGSGTILAFALGTEYAIRLPAEVSKTQRPVGLRTVAKWTTGGSTNIAETCGEDWIFGSFSRDEVNWCEQAFLACSRVAG